LKGTRRAVLGEIELWARDFDRPPIYWLNGLAGTGKSAIAQTISERMFADGQIGASFFCSRDFADRSNLQLIFPTLAVQLARRYTGFRSIFVPVVQSNPNIAHESLSDQMNKLIIRPLRVSAISTVIIIDALNECEDEEPASAILSVLGQFISRIPKVKFFLTGRPEPRIREGFRLPLMAEATDVFVLHEVEPSRITNDIRLFFRHELSWLAHRRGGLEDWLTTEHLDILCERAAGLFVYAVATANFIGGVVSDPKNQLDRILQSPESSAWEGKTKFKANATLDSLYTSILQHAFRDGNPEDDTRARSILSAVVLAANPLSPSAIATLLGFDAKYVLHVLLSANSLLIFEMDPDPVRPFHRSFPDFITDPTRCTDRRFYIFPPDHHLELLTVCLDLMNRTLEKNMCKLPDVIANLDVGDLKERSKEYVDPALRYACVSWHVHLIGARAIPSHASTITPTLHQFLEKKFLPWLEALSILGAARNVVEVLEDVMDWLPVR
jgi:hypothetical protein